MLAHTPAPRGVGRLVGGKYRSRLATVAAAAAVLTGCTTTIAGQALPADDLGHDPAVVPVAALEPLLLPPDQLSALLNTGALVIKKTRSKMDFEKTAAEDCAATFRAVWGPVYQGSGWVAVRAQFLTDPDDSTFKIWQGLVTFPLPIDAQAFYRKQVAAWHTCDNRRLDEHFVNNQPASDDWFKMGVASEHDGMLTMAHTQEVSDDNWTCERALTIRNNVAVDIEACASHRSDQAEVIANALAAKVPVK
jgi:hypothetical protein